MTDRTTVVLSHNLLTVTDADAILVLDEGHVIETHEELLAFNEFLRVSSPFIRRPKAASKRSARGPSPELDDVVRHRESGSVGACRMTDSEIVARRAKDSTVQPSHQRIGGRASAPPAPANAQLRTRPPRAKTIAPHTATRNAYHCPKLEARTLSAASSTLCRCPRPGPQ
jgi:hypothetical protein